MSKETDVQDRLQQTFREVFNDDSLVLRDDMMSDNVPGWDSVAHVNLMFAIEQDFGIQFIGSEMSEFQNVGAIREFLERATNGAK
jgi:acyl carrier protein